MKSKNLISKPSSKKSNGVSEEVHTVVVERVFFPAITFACPACSMKHLVPDLNGEGWAHLNAGHEGSGDCENCGAKLKLMQSRIISSANVREG
jgi:hypothetical protein